MQVMVLVLLFLSTVITAGVTRVGESTAHFEPHGGCVTKHVIVSKARAGDAASPEPWDQRDGSFVRARVVRDGTVEVERCVCEKTGASSVRVVVERRKE